MVTIGLILRLFKILFIYLFWLRNISEKPGLNYLGNREASWRWCGKSERKWGNWHMKNRHIQWWLALSFCFKVNNVNFLPPGPPTFHHIPLLRHCRNKFLHDSWWVECLRNVTACQEDRIPAQERYSHLGLWVRSLSWNAGPGCLMDWIFTFKQSQKYTLGGNLVLTFSAASTFELHAFLAAFSLVSQHASNSTPQHACNSTIILWIIQYKWVKFVEYLQWARLSKLYD